jgi:hypothetical protein
MYVCKNMNNVKNIFCSTKKDTQKEENDVKMTGKMTEKDGKEPFIISMSSSTVSI